MCDVQVLSVMNRRPKTLDADIRRLRPAVAAGLARTMRQTVLLSNGRSAEFDAVLAAADERLEAPRKVAGKPDDEDDAVADTAAPESRDPNFRGWLRLSAQSSDEALARAQAFM